jgi:hypothetical protein
MSQSDGRRRIKIQKFFLDPLSNWFFSRRTIGNNNGEKLEGSDNQYRSVFIPGRRSTEEIYTVNPGQDTLQFLYSSLKEAQTQDIRLGMYRSDNRFIYVDPTPGPNQTTEYSSFSQDILNNYLITCDKTLVGIMQNTGRGSIGFALKDQQTRSYTFELVNGVRTPQQTPFTRSGAEALHAALISDPAASVTLMNPIQNINTLGDFFTAVFFGNTETTSRVLSEQRNQNQTERLNLYDIVKGIFEDITSNTYNAGQQSRNVSALASALLVRTMLTQGLLTLNQAFAFMNSQTNYDYQYINIETSTPYVKNSGNARFLSDMRFDGPQDNPAVARPSYGFYEERYENNINVEGIDENLLPNLYARKFFQRAGLVQPQNLLEDEQRSQIRQDYQSLLTLTTDGENIIVEKGIEYFMQLFNSLDAGLAENFYSLYADLLDPEEPTYQFATQDLLNKNKQFMIGCNEMSETGLAAGASAMSINVSFERDSRSLTDVAEFIQTQDKDASLAVFQNMTDINDPDEQEFLYSTEYLVRNQQRETPKIPVFFKTYSLDGMGSGVISNVPETYSSTILQKKNQIPDRETLQQAQTYIQNNTRRRSPNNFSVMATGANTNSEVLGYRLRKIPSDAEGNFSEVYIGNGGRDRVVYTDTQVKYGVNYTYDLSEFRIVYGTSYNTYTLSTNVPSAILMGLLGFYNETETVNEMNRLQNLAQFSFINRSKLQPTADLVEIPVYDNFFLGQDIFPVIGGGFFDMLSLNARAELGAGGIAYPKTKVLNFPPTPPVLEFFPRAFVDSQIDISVTPVSGKTGTINKDDGTFDESLEIISIGDNSEIISEQRDFQRVQLDNNLQNNFLKYRFKSVSEVRNIIVYRTTEINLDVEDQKDLYAAFNPEANDDVVVRKYTTKRGSSEDLDNMVRVLSYDIRDSLNPNINYFYTCVVEDVHGNISNPSTIYRVRLLSESGMVIPEISTVIPKGTNRKTSDKNLARYIQIDASNIQTFPFVSSTEDGVINSRSLGAALNKKIESQSYIVRLTSKDTGRKFDLKLNFVVRINGNPINSFT